ncbi:MAG: TAXI family TRAP transporter solute-binding subunit [Nitrospinota bacterium]
MRARARWAMLAVILAFLVFPARAAKQYFAIATGGIGGTYYPLGGALAAALSERIPGLVATAQTGNASVANCNLIARRSIESAFVQNNVATWAYTGTGLFKGKRTVRNLRAIASLYPEAIQVVATRASGVRKITDLRGKRVIVGAPGSGTEVDARQVLKAHGLTYSDLKVDYLGFAEAVQRLKDGQTDAAFVSAGFPTASVLELSARTGVVILSITGEGRETLLRMAPYYVPAVIPAGTYRGMEKDVETVTTVAQWVVDANLPANLVYQMTRALWEPTGGKPSMAEVLANAHAKGREVTLKTALEGNGIPLHPGAERFYREKGLIQK